MKQYIFKDRKKDFPFFSFANCAKLNWDFFGKCIVIFFWLVLSFFPKNTIAQCGMSCHSQLNIALGGNGTFQVTPMTLLTNPFCDPNDFSVQVEDASGNPIDSLLTCDQVGQILTATVTSLIDGNTCQGNLNIQDNIAPVLTCPDVFIYCYESSHPDSIGYPTATDNCTAVAELNFSHSDNFTDLQCYTLQDGIEITAQTERTWTVSDEFGNTRTCTQNIYFRRVTTADISFPTNRDGFESPKLDCNDDPTDLNLTGQPTINGVPISSGGLCELAISYTDQTFTVCGIGGYNIIRTWTAVDWCSSDFILDAQVINVIDETAPTILCPADLTVGTTNNSCGGTVNFPMATATDDCSSYNITLTWGFGTGFGPFTDVPQGTYPATYTATDDCGNSTACIIQVTVEDNIAPIPICEFSLSTDLSTDGTATVNSSSFNNGSSDNCSVDYVEVSRDGLNFSNEVQFDCTDLELGSIGVTLRVFDLDGNQNQCTSMITVRDNMPPNIICPLPVTISCAADLSDLSITGNPIVTDNCAVDTVFFQDQMNVNSCNVGTITRTWTAVDQEDNSTFCIQILTLEDQTDLVVNFPANIDLMGCSSITTTDSTGVPIVSNDDCESVGVSHSDITFNNEAGLCKRILRTWTVIDWCIYDPNNGSGEGSWSAVQIIKVIDDGSEDNFSIAGVISNLNGNLLNDITVSFLGQNVDTSVLTLGGFYDLPDLSMEDSVIVTPSRDGDDKSGVNTLDLIFIRMHILGLNEFDSPYQNIAADVNDSGSITTYDMIIIRQLILDLIPELPGESWRFVDADYVFTNTDKPEKEDFPEMITVYPEGGEEYNFDFVAIKKGDVNGNASP